MLQRDIASVPSRKPDRWAAVLALGISFALHGGALAWFILLQETTPPEPYTVVAVELVQAADIMGPPAGTGPLQRESATITENLGDPERVAAAEPRDDTADTLAPPSVRDGPSVEQEEKPPQVFAHPPTPDDTSRPPQQSPAPADPIESSPPVPGRKPLQLVQAAERIPKQRVQMKDPPSQPAEQKSAPEPAQSDATRTSVRARQTATLDGGKTDTVSGLPPARKSGGSFGRLGDSSGASPQYSGAGLSNAAPRYPYLARRQSQEGRVVLRVQVTADGAAAAVRLRQSSGYRLLDEAAVEAVKKWRFVPAIRAGAPVAGSVDVPVSFKLTDG